VIPSYNQRDFLDEAIRSVLEQDVDIELIVLDGGSTDGSAEVIKRYADDLTYWRSAPDGGQAAAIQEGFARATGDVLGWLNSDDLLAPGGVRPVLEALRDHPEAGWAVAHASTVDAKSRHLLHRPTIPVRPADLYNLHLYLPQESTFFRRDVYRAVGGVDPSLRYAMDYDLWLRLARLGPPLYVDAHVGVFRVLNGQKSSDVTAYQAEEELVKRRYAGDFEVYGSFRGQQRMLAIRAARLLRRLQIDGAAGVWGQALRVWRGEQVSPGSTRSTILMAAGAAAGLLALTVQGMSILRRRGARPQRSAAGDA
jgi:glycosyltransferase involved in cell wall biosynthesis